VQLAKNLGCKAIWLNNDPALGGSEVKDDMNEIEGTIALETHSWEKIYAFLKLGLRKVIHERNTNENKIKVELNVSGNGKSYYWKPAWLFDHMLDQVARLVRSICLSLQRGICISMASYDRRYRNCAGRSIAMALADKKAWRIWFACRWMRRKQKC